MDSAVWGFIGVVIGGLITGLVTIRAESIRADKAAALDSARRQDDRRIGADNFQRETLLALQERLQEFMRAEVRGYHADLMTLRSEGQLKLLPQDVSEEMFEANRQLSYATERIRDDDLREMMGGLRRSVADIEARHVLSAASITEATLESDMTELSDQANAANTHLGIVLRRLL